MLQKPHGHTTLTYCMNTHMHPHGQTVSFHSKRNTFHTNLAPWDCERLWRWASGRGRGQRVSEKQRERQTLWFSMSFISWGHLKHHKEHTMHFEKLHTYLQTHLCYAHATAASHCNNSRRQKTPAGWVCRHNSNSISIYKHDNILDLPVKVWFRWRPTPVVGWRFQPV